MLAKSHRRTAADAPHELHEVHEIRVGYEVLGAIGRFKGAKTWWYARASFDGGKTVFSWTAQNCPSREAAEQQCINRWSEMQNMEACARVRASMRRDVEDANDRANNAEHATTESALQHATPAQLMEALECHPNRRAMVDVADAMLDLSLSLSSVDGNKALEIAKDAGLSAHDLDDTLLDRVALHDDVVRVLNRLAYAAPADVSREARHLLASEFGRFDGRLI